MTFLVKAFGYGFYSCMYIFIFSELLNYVCLILNQKPFIVSILFLLQQVGEEDLNPSSPRKGDHTMPMSYKALGSPSTFPMSLGGKNCIL